MAETVWPRPSCGEARAGRPTLLDANECVALLCRGDQGHVALRRPTACRGHQGMWPVSYRVASDRILFRLPARACDGTPLLELALHAYGVDGAELWSVVVTGDARDVTDPLELLARQIGRLRRGPAETDPGSLIELRPGYWSGCRFRRGLAPGS